MVWKLQNNNWVYLPVDDENNDNTINEEDTKIFEVKKKAKKSRKKQEST